MEVFQISKSKGVYQIHNTVNGRLYVGSTYQNFSKRWSQWRTDLDLRRANPNLSNAWHKYSADAFEFSVLEEIDTTGLTTLEARALILSREQHYIYTLKPYYNFYKVAGSPTGWVQNQETKDKRAKALRGQKRSDKQRARMSEAQRGNQNNLGKTRGEDTRRKISEANKGQTSGPWTGGHVSDEAKEKIRQANLGQTRSDEARQRMSEAGKARIARDGVKCITYQIMDPNGVIHTVYGQREFATQHGLSQAGLSLLLSGKMKRGFYKGWRTL